MGADAAGKVNEALVLARRKQRMLDNKARLSKGEAMTMALSAADDDEMVCIVSMNVSMN